MKHSAEPSDPVTPIPSSSVKEKGEGADNNPLVRSLPGMSDRIETLVPRFALGLSVYFYDHKTDSWVTEGKVTAVPEDATGDYTVVAHGKEWIVCWAFIGPA